MESLLAADVFDASLSPTVVDRRSNVQRVGLAPRTSANVSPIALKLAIDGLFATYLIQLDELSVAIATDGNVTLNACNVSALVQSGGKRYGDAIVDGGRVACWVEALRGTAVPGAPITVTYVRCDGGVYDLTVEGVAVNRAEPCSMQLSSTACVKDMVSPASIKTVIQDKRATISVRSVQLGLRALK
jgi:hypothetical protein